MNKVVVGAILSFLGLLVLAVIVACFTSHIDTIKKIAIPMERNIVLFYRQHQRHPTFDETPELLKRSGCEYLVEVSKRDWGHGKNETEYSCVFSGNKIMVTTNIVTDVRVPYYFRFHKGKSGCRIGLLKNGKSLGVPSCGQSACIFGNWSA